jgi:hypothetical protein
MIYSNFVRKKKGCLKVWVGGHFGIIAKHNLTGQNVCRRNNVENA